jgi:hypothetical protein
MSKIAKFGWELLKNEETIALWSSQILYVFALRAGKITIFEPKIQNIFANFTGLYFLHFTYNILQPILQFYSF